MWIKGVYNGLVIVFIALIIHLGANVFNFFCATDNASAYACLFWKKSFWKSIITKKHDTRNYYFTLSLTGVFSTHCLWSKSKEIVLKRKNGFVVHHTICVFQPYGNTQLVNRKRFRGSFPLSPKHSKVIENEDGLFFLKN